MCARRDKEEETVNSGEIQRSSQDWRNGFVVFRVQTALLDVPGSFPSTHMSETLLPGDLTFHSYMDAGKIPMHAGKREEKKRTRNWSSQGWRDSSVVTSTCSYKGSGFYSQHQHSGSQHSVTLVQDNPTLSPDLL